MAFPLSCRQQESRADSNPPPIEIRATVEPAQMTTVTAQLDGQVRDLLAKAGSKVSAGGALVRLSNPVVERDAAVARANLEWIEARARGERPPAPAAPAQPRDNLEITAKILELKRDRFEKMKELRRTNDITQRELEYAEVEYLAAQREYNNERRVRAVAPPAPAQDVAVLRAERQRGTAEQRFAAQRESLLTITTPISGVVTRLHVKPGQSVLPREPVADVSDSTSVHVRGELAPELVRYVRPGQRVDVRIMSVPPRTFADEIEYVMPVAPGSGSRNATVVVTLPNPDGSLQPSTEAVITLR
jgi:multidrug resistance efflux pump